MDVSKEEKNREDDCKSDESVLSGSGDDSDDDSDSSVDKSSLISRFKSRKLDFYHPCVYLLQYYTHNYPVSVNESLHKTFFYFFQVRRTCLNGRNVFALSTFVCET